MNATMIDEERSAKRAELKRRIAERAVQKRQLASLRKLVAEINARSDAASDIHRDECRPLQEELETLSANQIEAVLANEPSDPEDDARRLEILTEIERHNSTLELETKSNGSLIDHIEKQIGEVGSVISKTVILESQLSRLADQKLLDRKEVLQSRIRWADRRLQAAGESLANYQANLNAARRSRPRAVHGYETLVAEARRELQDAQRQAAEVQADQNELRKEMLE